ncbi:hypothetical protein MRX96_049844 [Rhipicephalus microplus]
MAAVHTCAARGLASPAEEQARPGAELSLVGSTGVVRWILSPRALFKMNARPSRLLPCRLGGRSGIIVSALKLKRDLFFAGPPELAPAAAWCKTAVSRRE